MKTIHLTENDILDIVNKVIYEQKTLNTTQPDPNNLTPEDLIKDHQNRTAEYLRLVMGY